MYEVAEMNELFYELFYDWSSEWWGVYFDEAEDIPHIVGDIPTTVGDIPANVWEYFGYKEGEVVGPFEEGSFFDVYFSYRK